MKIFFSTDKGVSAVCRDHREAHIMSCEAMGRGEVPSIDARSDAVRQEECFFRAKPFDKEGWLLEQEAQRFRQQIKELEATLALEKQRGYTLTRI
jgi:hypothetical protein